MSSVIVPKSDQINAEDFIAGPRTFTIEGVAISPGTEQPVSIKLAGEQRVFRPCKSMSRVLVGGWGADASAYKGRSLTLYRDPKVKWGGLEVGGIRISHMSHIERDMVMSLTATKGKRAPHQVKVLQGATTRQQESQSSDTSAAEKWVSDHIGFVVGATTLERLQAVQENGLKAMAKLAAGNPELHKRVVDSYAKRLDELSGDDPFGDPRTEGRDDRDMGETRNDTLADHLFRAIADRLIARAATVELMADLQKIEDELDLSEGSAPAELFGEVEEAIAAARARISNGGK